VDLFDSAQIALSAAMRGASARQTALADNLANVDTPGYVRKDVSFHDELRTAMAGGADASAMSVAPQADASAPVRVDGNSVDVDAENTALSQNALEYDALARVSATRIDILKSAMGVA
jgi:flagellar basal-body rod protein FlgB